MMADIPAGRRNTPQGRRELKVTGMMLVEPHIDAEGARDHHRADAGAGRRSRRDPRRAHHRHLPPRPQQPAGHLPERHPHDSVRRSGDVQRDRRALPPHAVREAGADQGHDDVAGEDEERRSAGATRMDTDGDRDSVRDARRFRPLARPHDRAGLPDVVGPDGAAPGGDPRRRELPDVRRRARRDDRRRHSTGARTDVRVDAP